MNWFVLLAAVAAIVVSLILFYDKPFYYLKLSVWSLGFILIGTSVATLGVGMGFLGALLIICSILFACAPPILYATLLLSGIGGLLLGAAI